MELHNLKPARGSVKGKNKRVGRGQGSGRGGTSTHGHKGQQSDSGYNTRRAHEGGQMPLQRRLPKFGFTNIFRREYQGINIDTLQKLADEKKVPAYIVFSDVTLRQMAREMPKDEEELLEVSGVGEKKLREYGNAFLQEITQYKPSNS